MGGACFSLPGERSSPVGASSDAQRGAAFRPTCFLFSLRLSQRLCVSAGKTHSCIVPAVPRSGAPLGVMSNVRHGKPETDYYGCQMVLRTTDAGVSWTELSPSGARTRRGPSLPAVSLAIISARCSMARSSFPSRPQTSGWASSGRAPAMERAGTRGRRQGPE